MHACRKHAMLKTIYVAVALLLPSLAGAQTKPDIDLIAGKVNGHAMAELTIDQVTDLFGRPSATTAPRLVPGAKTEGGEIRQLEYPSTLVYGELGLTFRFMNARSDTNQQIASILIHLSRHTNADTHTLINAYVGAITRDVDGNWKAKRVMEAFKEFTPIDSYDPKRAQELRALEERAKAAGIRRVPSLVKPSVTVNTADTWVSFKYQDQTKFIEEIEVGYRRKTEK